MASNHLSVEKLLSVAPSWVPFAPKVIFLTGVFEFAASFALIARPFRFWAGIATAIYVICVWPANFKHAMNGIDLPSRREFIKLMVGTATRSIVRQAILFAATLWAWPDFA